MIEKTFEIISRRRSHDGFFKLDVCKLRHATFDGGQSEILEREIYERGHAVAVLPYDPILDQVVLIEQFRPGAMSVPARYPEMPVWLNEVVAGIIEEGEQPEDVARRETREESGCKIIGNLEQISRFYVSPGGSSETVTLFYGRVDADQANGIHGLSEEGEDIRVFTVSAEECFEMLQQGQLCNATTTIAVQWLMINRERIRRQTATSA
ncbi:NUDIX domain-containing protein [Thalassospira sp. MA62]|nr:NUDIX domain-containing protein [Thalassospira sp. MA62]